MFLLCDSKAVLGPFWGPLGTLLGAIFLETGSTRSSKMIREPAKQLCWGSGTPPVASLGPLPHGAMLRFQKTRPPWTPPGPCDACEKLRKRENTVKHSVFDPPGSLWKPKVLQIPLHFGPPEAVLRTENNSNVKKHYGLQCFLPFRSASGPSWRCCWGRVPRTRLLLAQFGKKRGWVEAPGPSEDDLQNFR